MAVRIQSLIPHPWLASRSLSMLSSRASASRPRLAFLLTNCRPGDSDLVCRLRSILAMLNTAAWILGTLLVLAILAAVWAYKRKPQKLTPEDITPDAR